MKATRPVLLLTAGASAVAAASTLATAQCAELVELVHQPATAHDHLGGAVATDGARVAVGAANASQSEPGAAFLFSGAEWGLEQQLLIEDAAGGDRLGAAVAVEGDWAAVGAPGDDEAGDGAGAVHVFIHDGVAWVAAQKLTAAGAEPGDGFGSAVAIDGDVLVVGAPARNALYVFRRDGRQWDEIATLNTPPFSSTTQLGFSVAVDAGVVVAGGVYIDAVDMLGTAHVFEEEGGRWAHQQQLIVPATWASGFFGVPVAIDGSVVVVGAYLDPANGVASGAAHVFRRSIDTWEPEQTVYSPDPAVSDTFGCDVALDGPRLLVGSRGDDGAGNGTGAAFVFDFDGEQWVIAQELSASSASELDAFGVSVALAGEVAVIGAPLADPGADAAGAAYVFGCAEEVCPTDVTGDGVTDVADLIAVITAWGTSTPAADVDGSGTVDVADLIAVITGWGPCT